jgi:hypothetical protein
MLAMPNLAEAQNQDLIRMAETCLQQGLYSQVITTLNQYKLKDKQDYADYLRALAYLKQNNTREAIKILQDFAGKWPQSGYLYQAIFLLAENYLKTKDYQGAEKIYSEQARRLLSEDRKQEIASIYIKLAESLAYQPQPEELDLPPPDFPGAYRFYAETLKLEIGQELREEVRYRMAGIMKAAKNNAQAATDYLNYLAEFDPDWNKNPLLRSQGKAGEKSEVYRGKYIYQARLQLATALLAGLRLLEARQVLEDTLTLLKSRVIKADTPSDRTVSMAEITRRLAGLPEKADNYLKAALRQLPYTYRLPQPATDFELEGGIKAIDDFLSLFPDDSLACTLAWHKAQSLLYRGRSEKAGSALKDIIDQKNFRLPELENPDAKRAREELGVFLSPEEQYDNYQKEALAKLGELYFNQANYALAIKTYTDYVARFPNGPHWAAAQQGIIDAEYQTGVDKLNEKKYNEAENIWNTFLTNHPLDPRSRKILFTLGQIQYQEGLNTKARDKKQAADWFARAIISFKKLIAKYPGTEESSLAQLRVGEIQEQELGDFETALKTYRALNWGSSAQEAGSRVSRMVNKELIVRTERSYRTNEPAVVKIQVRNIEKLRLSAYKLNLEAYFRKYHGITGIEELDLSLIAPDASWEVELAGYKPYLPLEQEIEIPMKGPGVYAVTVSSTELEATSLVIRSNIELILKSSRQEVLVFVEDMLQHKPVSAARVLLTDGQKVIFEGQTGSDGVLLKKSAELASLDDLHAFVASQDNVAATGLSIAQLGFASGLQPKGYIYTERPAYKPGEIVQLKGIIRDVVNGSYEVATGSRSLSVADAAGRVVHQEEVTLSPFGTFHTSLTLSGQAGPGEYTIQLVTPGTAQHFNGHFKVEDYKLEKIRLKINFDRAQYFRGEPVKLELKAEYYFGQPVAEHELTYRTPDGLTHQAETDSQGKCTFEFDTTPFNPGQSLVFSADLSGENVRTSGQITLVAQEFTLAVTTRRTIALAGLPVEVTVKAINQAQEKLIKEVEVSLYKRVSKALDPLVENIPWLREAQTVALSTYTEVATDKQTVQTNAEGTGRLTFKPASGGTYIIRAYSKDRLGQTITGETSLFVSDETDQTRLRFFANRETYRVGDTDSLLLHSRLKNPALALLTFTGEGIISYAILPLNKVENSIPLTIKHTHFPNFTVAANVMDGNRFYEATTDFSVERKLMVEIKPAKQIFAPEETGEVEILVKDQQGQPVAAEFSLALVNEALFDLYPDPLPDIIHFFQDGMKRETSMTSVTSCTFYYAPVSVAVNLDIQTEAERLVEELDNEEDAGYEKKEYFREEAQEMNAPPKKTRAKYDKDEALDDLLSNSENKPEEAEQAREDLPTQSYWLAAVVTNKQGLAKVAVPLPGATGAYRLHIKSCSKETLLGQGSHSLVIRKEFFVSLKTPALLQEADEVRFIGRIHNLGAYTGPVQATLLAKTEGKTLELAVIETTIKAQETKEVLFPAYTVPLTKQILLSCELKAGGITQDRVQTPITIRPWGLPFSVRKTGTTHESRTVFMSLDEKKTYTSRQLSLTVSPGFTDSLLQLVLDSNKTRSFHSPAHYVPFYLGPEAELLAISSVIQARSEKEEVPGSYQQLVKQLYAVLSALISAQDQDGSWHWAKTEQIPVTTQAYWGLHLAAKNGFRIDAQTVEKAKQYLKKTFTALPQDDNESKAQILHALSLTQDADYTFINRLYRIRNELSEAALAFLALSLITMDKKDIALELLTLLEQKAIRFELEKEGEPGGAFPRKARLWQGLSNHPWLRNSLETTALVLSVYMQLRPQDPAVTEGIEYLKSEYKAAGFAPAKALGYVVRTLSEYNGPVQAAKHDFTVKVKVNDTPVGEFNFTAASASNTQTLPLLIPDTVCKAGNNQVQFVYSGKGDYFYQVELTGFSTDLNDPQSWTNPHIASKKWIHEPLRYKGRSLTASTTEITQLELNQTLEVIIAFQQGWHANYLVLEEYLPAGVTLLKETITGSYDHVAYQDNKLLFYLAPHRSVSEIRYQLAAYTPGKYQVLPSVLREVFQPQELRLGQPMTLTLLGPSEKSTDTYIMNENELFALGSAFFKDGEYEQALAYLEKLYQTNPKNHQPDLARMLFWIRTDADYFQAARIVEYFEILKEKYPDLFIPFTKILAVGKAYEELHELERAYLVYRAIIEASFIKDSTVGGNLESAQEILGSIDYMLKLIGDYPTGGATTSSLFALSQTVYSYAARAETITRRINLKEKDSKKVTKQELLEQADTMFWNFMSHNPDHEMVDDAAFTVLNIQLDKKNYTQAVSLSRDYQKRYAASPFLSTYQYMEALANFSQRKYQEAVTVARTVADGKSDNKNLATYILGQIYHAQRKPQDALKYYELVRGEFTDAAEASQYFTRQAISLDEVSIFTPGEKIALKLKYRNIKELNLQVYKVDLMKLYLREKNLSKITRINLAGITPSSEQTLALGKGTDYEDKVHLLTLALKGEGAYLVVCRGDDLFASGLVLITPFTIEVQEDAVSGRVRVNVFDKVRGIYPDTVHVKVIGSDNTQFVSGNTDLRGIFIADGIKGEATVIARDSLNRYAFHRGQTWLGEADQDYNQNIPEMPFQVQDDFDAKYRGNLFKQQEQMQEQNKANLKSLYEQQIDGVQVNQAY